VSEAVTTVHEGPVLVVTVDRPKANAIDATTSRRMGEVFAAAEADADVRAVIVTGAGERFFSAGWDLNAAAEGEEYDADYGVGGFGGFTELPDRTKPVIAAVNGMAVGGGFEIAMAADFVVAADHAQFFLPEVRLGLLPDAGAVKLPRLLPPHLAREVLLTDRRLGADEAMRWGLVARVVPGAELMAAAHALAREIVAAAPLSVAAILDIARRTETMATADAMAALRSIDSYRRAIDSRDAVEGPLARAEQRTPRWLGY
jgi:crotonobetainyl-CoA hydratase